MYDMEFRETLGDWGTWRPGDWETLGDWERGRQGDGGTRRPGDQETGDLEAWGAGRRRSTVEF